MIPRVKFSDLLGCVFFLVLILGTGNGLDITIPCENLSTRSCECGDVCKGESTCNVQSSQNVISCGCKNGFYGNPLHEGCMNCTSYCNNRTNSCMIDDVSGVNPIEKCKDCAAPFSGDRCDECPKGQYEDFTTVRCVDCNCNGHGSECSKFGKCTCFNNTIGSNCTQCKNGFLGEPSDGRPCFQVTLEGQIYNATTNANELDYVVISPKFTNVDILLTISITSGGPVKAFVTTDSKTPKNESKLLGEFASLRSDVVLESGANDFREDRFFIYLEALTTSSYKLVFSQTVVQIDLFVFFSVFFSAFYLFLTTLSYAWHWKMRYERHQAFVYHMRAVNHMRSRPSAHLKIVLKRQRKDFPKNECSPVVAVEYLSSGKEALLTTLVELPTPKDCPPRVSFGCSKVLMNDPNNSSETDTLKRKFSLARNRIAQSITSLA
eukprot:Nk52_evm6s2356 gene=Nk52_evmTU6s2356